VIDRIMNKFIILLLAIFPNIVFSLLFIYIQKLKAILVYEWEPLLVKRALFSDLCGLEQERNSETYSLEYLEACSFEGHFHRLINKLFDRPDVLSEHSASM